MLSLSPVLHPIWIAGWLALTAGLAVMLYLRLRGHVAPLYISGLVALRIIFVLLLTLLLLQPFFSSVNRITTAFISRCSLMFPVA